MRQLVSKKNRHIFKIAQSLMGTCSKWSKTFQSELFPHHWQFQYVNCSMQSSSSSWSTESIVDNTPFLETHKQSQKVQDQSLETICKIYNTISKERDKIRNNIKSLCKEECFKILELLLRYRVPEEEITQILLEFPQLLTFAHSEWEETVKKLLRDYQFNPSQLLHLLAETPSILEGSAWKTLYDVIALLRSWGIREGKMQMIIIKNPDLLQTNLKTISNNYAKLCEVFTKSNVISLVLSNPVILTDEWEVTYSKITYVFDRMGAKLSEILRSHMFKHNLEHIIMRHEFLERAGLYSKPDKRGISKCENAPLQNITDSDDKAFAKLVASLSHAEYMAFVDIKRQEFEDAQSNDVESEDELFE